AKQIRSEIIAEVCRMRCYWSDSWVGDRKDSVTYLRKKEACEFMGIISFEANLPKDSTEQQ
ncbi:hypothetical protein HN51_028152, partial [Arachis hypogaea]